MKFRLRNIQYFLYVNYKKACQFIKVTKEYKPKILDDVTFVPASGSLYAIVVLYPTFGVADDYIDLLRSLRRTNINVIVVCNGRPKPEIVDRLSKEAHRLLVRRNIGRDIGAYRAATLYLNAMSLPASRVLYFNDSLIYLAGAGLDRMIQGMIDDAYPVIGTFENHEYEHHFGSFAFSISGEVFKNPKMLAFWRRYRPYNIRPHAIKNGEIGMSRRLKKLGYNINVIYSINRLGEKFHEMDAARLIDLVSYMPTAWRSHFLDRTRHGPLGPALNLDKEFSEASSLPSPPAGPMPLGALSGIRLRPQVEARVASLPSLPLSVARINLSKMAFIDLLLGEISSRSQIHSGFGVFHLLMDAPLVKKDLLQRGVFVEHDCNFILKDVPDGMRAAVMRQLINRGRPLHFTGLKRFLVQNGFE